ncbi:hypothetical protein PLANPX_1182 [Lacipirellula parvula]|uniref:Uncharacterized protein n=1 Tax=Lacipirellula parvula TaxID=2650471 RepID=A0A5K7X4U8_9BACT|nr:hypothetical protein PLANPX_1182 [Lacipirellula parvula]
MFESRGDWSTRVASRASDLFSPLLLCLALAIRATKVTGEILLEKPK